MKLLFRNLYCLPIFAILIACNSRADNFSSPPMAAERAEMGMEHYDEAQPTKDDSELMTAEIERQIIRNGTIRMLVEDVEVVSDYARQLTGDLGGYVSQAERRSSNYSLESDLVLRVPAHQLDTLVTQLEARAKHVELRNISAQDVTEEYVDLTARLAAKQKVRDRYAEILDNQARTVEDILEVEEAMRKVQEEIESAEGRLKYIQSQVSMSTLRLSIYQQITYTEENYGSHETFASRLGRAFHNGWTLLGDLFLGIISTWPIWLLIALVVWGGRRFLRWRKSRYKNTFEES